MKITDKIISLDCTVKGGCSYCLKTNEGYVLIDTGMPHLTNKILDELKTYNIYPNQIKKILLTHGDVDHIGNVNKIRRITGCDVFADSQEIPYLKKEKHYSTIKAFFKILLGIGKILDVQALPKNKISQIEIIKTPGHTPGHVCFKFDKFIFLGDLAEVEKNGEISILPKTMTFNTDQLIKSIKSLSVVGIEFLCMAHGGIVSVFE
jgi:glyoxylase-like metal-dependent hydrolase (beta-lactamase superfamily II)